MHTDQFNHAPAEMLLYTGNQTVGKPSMGSWATWGLGSENQDLPGFVVLVSGGSDPTGGKSLWSSGFLPSEYQGVRFRSEGDPVLYVSDPKGLDRKLRRRMLDALKDLNETDLERHGDPETKARIAQYELAFRMQMAVPEVTDLSRESSATLERYGAVPGVGSFAGNCLLARNLLESGVRFVQLYDWGWDIHGTSTDDDLITKFPAKCRDIDRPDRRVDGRPCRVRPARGHARRLGRRVRGARRCSKPVADPSSSDAITNRTASRCGSPAPG